MSCSLQSGLLHLLIINNDYLQFNYTRSLNKSLAQTVLVIGWKHVPCTSCFLFKIPSGGTLSEGLHRSLFSPPTWEWTEQEWTLHYLPIVFYKSPSDEKNDSVNNQGSQCCKLPLCVDPSAKKLSVTCLIVLTILVWWSDPVSWTSVYLAPCILGQ